MKYSLRSLMIVVAAAIGTGLLAGAVWGVSCLIREHGEMIRDSYCLDWASAMIVQFMDDNDGRYPRDWNDLRGPFQKTAALDGSFSFEEIKSRVEIDFSADKDDSPFVTPTSGREAAMRDPDPNDRIWKRIAAGTKITP